MIETWVNQLRLLASGEAAQQRLAPDAAIAARNQRPNALSGCLVAKAPPRIRRAGEAERYIAEYQMNK